MKKYALILLLFYGIMSFSQEKTQTDRMIEEIQQIKQNQTEMKLVWWIPTEYWEVALQENASVTAEQLNYLKELLNDYTIIAAGNYKLDSDSGGLNFTVIDSSKKVVFYGLQGQKVPPLKESEIDNKVLIIVNQSLKPLFAQMLGKMGSGVNFFIYNNVEHGKRIIDPNQTGNFKVDLNGEIFQWKLPLVSLMDEKTCPVDQQKMSGNWNFCPFHGNKL